MPDLSEVTYEMLVREGLVDPSVKHPLMSNFPSELDNLESALERGIISEEEHDAEVDSFIREQNNKGRV